MNKIFKVIWNHAAQRFDVVSELTKSNGKSSSTTDNRIEPSKALLAIGVAGAALLGSADVMAATVTVTQPVNDPTDGIVSGTEIRTGSNGLPTIVNSPLYIRTSHGTTYDNGILIGSNTSALTEGGGYVVIGEAAQGTSLSVVIGHEAASSGQQDVVIGAGAEQKNTASSSYSVVIGRDAENQADGQTAISIGYKTVSNGLSAIALGTNAKAVGSRTTAMGENASSIAKESVAIGYNSQANAEGSVGIGRSSLANNTYAIALGQQAGAQGLYAISMGALSKAHSSNAIALGPLANVTTSGLGGIAIGRDTVVDGNTAVSIGRSSHANGSTSVALGATSRALADNSIVIGNTSNTTTGATNSIIVGNSTVISGSSSIAIGTGANVTGNSSIAVGLGNVVTGDSAGAFGDPSLISGDGAYTLGNDNVVGSQSTNVGAFGNNNQIGATGTYSNGKLQTASGLANEVTVANSRVVGNNNYINSSNTYVLGSGVGVKDDGSVMDTVANSVYLGNDSTITSSNATITAANAGSVKNLDKDGDAGATSTAGSKGTVSEAVVSTLTYGTFAGATSVGAVTVGSAGEERRIVNLAAGEISKTSTDAINGSQLYAVTEVIGKGINIQNNAGGDVANILPGEAIAFKDGNLTTANVTAVGGNVSVSFDVDKGTFDAPNDGKLVSSTTDTGVATVADVANAVNAGYWKVGNKDAVVNNVNFGDDVRFLNGTNTTVTVAADGADRTNITIDTDFSKLPTLNTTTANITNNGGTISVDVNTGVGSVNGDTGVASVNNGDTNKVANISNVVELVNNTGWNVFQDSDASANKKDLVVAGDNVVFAAGTNTTVSVETDAAKKTTTIKYDVDLSKVTTTPENTTLSVTNGAVDTPAEGGKLVNATTVADAINDSGWQTTLTDGTVETINPGDKVNYVNGTTTTANVVKDATGNVNVTFEVNKQDITATDGKAALEGTTTNADNFVTAGDVINTINNVYWTATSDTDGGKFATTGHTKSDAQVKAGDAVTFKAGEGLTIKQDGRNFTYAVAAGDVTSDTNVANVTTTLGKAAADTTSGTVATVGDVADAINNSGWVTTTTAGDTVVVNPGDTVSYVDGTNTKANVVTNADGGVDVTFDVNTGTSSVTTDGKAEADTTNGDVATITDVVNTINNVYWNTVAGNVTGTNGEFTSDATAKVKAGDTVTHNAGQNIKIEQKGATFNISTTENVTFTNAVVNSTLSLGNVSDAAAPVVNMTSQAAVPATNNDLVNNKAPTTALNITAKDGNPTQITGVGSVLNTTNVETNPDADTATNVVNSPLVNLGTAAAPLADNILNSAATVRDLTNMGWVVSTETGEYKDTVKNANEVKFVAGSDRVSVTGKTVNDVRTITIDLAAVTTGEVTDPNTKPTTGDVNFADTDTTDVTVNPNTGVVTVDAKTTDLTPATDGSITTPTTDEGKKLVNATTVANAINNSGFTLKSSAAEGTKVSGDDEVINPGDVVDMAAGKNMTVKQEKNGKITYATADDVTFNSTKVGGTYTDAQGNVVNNAPITIGTTPEGKNVISNLNSTLPTTVSTGDKATSTTKVDAPVIAAGDMTNAATLGDVLNAGWNLKTADQGDLDFVKPYDTVNFVNGVGTSVVSSTNGNVSNIQYNVNVDGTTTEITYVTKVNGKDVPVYQHVDGNYYTGENGTGTKVETPVTSRISAILPKTQVNGNNVTGPVNLVNGDTTTVTNTPDGIKVEVNTGNTTVGTDGKAAPLAPEDANKVVTVGDIVNTINNVSWNAIAGKVAGSNGEVTGNASTPVKAGDTVTYNAGNNIKIEQTGTTFNISTTDNVTFTNTNVTGNLTVEGNTTVNNFTVNPNSTINMGGNTITNIKDGEKPTDAATVQQLENVTKNITGALSWKVTGNNNADNATTVGNQTVSFNNGTGTTAVVNGTNVTYNVNFGNLTSNANGTVSAVDNGDISPANQVASVEGVQNAINNSGWLTTNSDGSTSLINPGDTVNYVNGTNTVANVTTVDGTTTVSFDAKTTDLTVNDNGTIATPAEGSSLVNASTLANTVNNVSWTVNASTVEGSTGVSEYTGSDKVKAGDTVTINAGNNVIVSGSGKTINIATSTAPTFTTVQVGGSTGPVIGADENGDVKVSKADGSAAKITNVAAGTADTDAVNVGQLKQVAGDIHNKINRNNKDLRAGIAGANAAAGLPQVYIPGKSMIAASAGTFKGQSAVAVGYSRASDNGKLILKLQGNANTRGDIGGSVGVGYQW